MSETTAERAVLSPQEAFTQDAAPVTIPAVTLEFVFYALLFALAAALRLFVLESAPQINEIPNLLAAWRGGESASPALLWAQAISFDLLGGSIFAARIVTALVGLLLALSPVMFRAELGRTRALLLTVMLVTAAPMVIAARESAPVIWTALFGAVALRLWLNHFYAPDEGRGLRAVIATAALVLLGDPSGVILALALAGGAALALFWRAATADSDSEAQSGLAAAGAAFARIAWDKSVLAAALVVVAVASGFMTGPSGLSSIGGLLGGIFALARPDGDSLLAISVYYQLVLWGLSAAALLLNRREGWNAADRFFVGWLLVMLIAAALLPGLTAQHSILIALPLAGLASRLAAYAFAPDKRQRILSEQYSANGDELAMLISPPAGRFILMLVVFALLCIFNVHLSTTAREFLLTQTSDLVGVIARLQQNTATADFRIGLLWSFITVMFLLIGFFLAGSIWGNRVAAQGYILGFFALLAATQLSGGWYVSVFASDSAVEPWHYEAVTPSYLSLERSLDELNFREAQGFARLPITVLRDPSNGLTENGLLGWLLRDFERVRWVDTLAEAEAAPIIIAPDSNFRLAEGVQPDFGGSYVGQPFILTQRWSPDLMFGFDFASWYLQRNVRIDPSARLSVALWLRQDVFDSSPVQELLD